MEISTKVKPPTDQVPLLDYMTARFTYRTREIWTEMIQSGNVLFEGEKTTVDQPVSAGDTITSIVVDPNPPTANYNYTIVYEDEDLLAVNKPSNLRVHGRGRYIHANLIHHIRHVRPDGYPEAGLINRLDANTTGLVLLSKSHEMLVKMQKLFQDRQIFKTYQAVVKGVPETDGGIINSPVGRLPSADGVYRYGDHPLAEKLKPAETEWRVMQQLANGFTLVELKPKTGRTHQLRVHMASIGHPLAGDAVYQLNDADYLRWCDDREAFPDLGFYRHALHCWKYEFTNPITQKSMELIAPPADFDSFYLT